ncbi:MAG: hypothetical protein WBG17_09335 [Burkholderiaceae bacterium]
MLYKLAFAGVTLELGALLLFAESQGLLLGVYLLLHGAGSLLIAMAVRILMPPRYRRPRRWLLAYLFCFNFFVPLVGLLCAALAIAVGVWLPRLAEGRRFGTTAVPRFTTHRNHEGTGFRGGQVRAQLGNSQAPLDHRLKALVAVQDTPARTTGALLRDLLADPTDDIRLLAYGILDNKEKQITQKILARKLQLQQAGSDEKRASLDQRIAELYWELIYQNLVQGDMQLFSAEQTRLHARRALSILPDNAGIWFLLARLELHMRQVEAAEAALLQAQQGGFARERMLPYLAELRFLQRRHAEVRALFAELRGRPGVPALLPVRRYWRGDADRAAMAAHESAESGLPAEPELAS